MRRHVPLKHWLISSRLVGIVSQNFIINRYRTVLVNTLIGSLFLKIIWTWATVNWNHVKKSHCNIHFIVIHLYWHIEVNSGMCLIGRVLVKLHCILIFNCSLRFYYPFLFNKHNVGDGDLPQNACPIYLPTKFNVSCGPKKTAACHLRVFLLIHTTMLY
jgi:hypothetical protein